MIVPVIAISNLVLTQQIYSEETNGAHAHYREPVPLKENAENLNYHPILRRKEELYLFLSTQLSLLANAVNSGYDQGERCLSPMFFTLLICWHVQFSKIFAFLFSP